MRRPHTPSCWSWKWWQAGSSSPWSSLLSWKHWKDLKWPQMHEHTHTHTQLCHFNTESSNDTLTSSSSFPSLRVPLASSARVPRIPSISQNLHGCVEIVISEVSLRKQILCIILISSTDGKSSLITDGSQYTSCVGVLTFSSTTRWSPSPPAGKT